MQLVLKSCRVVIPDTEPKRARVADEGLPGVVETLACARQDNNATLWLGDDHAGDGHGIPIPPGKLIRLAGDIDASELWVWGPSEGNELFVTQSVPAL